jgi:VWFA-related protein
VAVLVSGAELEDLVIVASSVAVESIDAQLVELYVSVLDGRGRGVTGLKQESFTVHEDGEIRPVVRFANVADLAIDVGLLMDVSASMRRGLSTAAESARRFFDTVIGPKDQAMVVAFNHQLDLLEPFTGDIGRLRYATTGLRAWGTTRLRDGIVFSLHGFGGQQGRRALIVLSDGQDVDSDFDADQVLSVALRAGVAVYPIVLDASESAARTELERLADETGGRLFVVASVRGLDRVYQQIEDDLRAQYLLVYQPPAQDTRQFRKVDVSIASPGLRVRTISGYHP